MVERLKIAYTEQRPFLLAGTLRDNVVFGMEFVSAKFNYVAHLACLEEDFLQFPKGSRTLIGEGGATLSGGQKARIALARALYADADLYLLDDPLAALDPKVATQVLREAILTHLKGKTRVLITQNPSVLSKADRVLYLKNGRISFLGSLKELEQLDMDLSHTLRSRNGSPHKKLSSSELSSLLRDLDEDEDVCPIVFSSYTLRMRES